MAPVHTLIWCMVLCAPRVYSQTASRSVHPFWQGSRSRPKDTDTHTGKSRCICSNSPHLLPCIAMWPNYGFQTVIWLFCAYFLSHAVCTFTSCRVVRCQCAHGPQLSVHIDWSDACLAVEALYLSVWCTAGRTTAVCFVAVLLTERNVRCMHLCYESSILSLWCACLSLALSRLSSAKIITFSDFFLRFYWSCIHLAFSVARSAQCSPLSIRVHAFWIENFSHFKNFEWDARRVSPISCRSFQHTELSVYHSVYRFIQYTPLLCWILQRSMVSVYSIHLDFGWSPLSFLPSLSLP